MSVLSYTYIYYATSGKLWLDIERSSREGENATSSTECADGDFKFFVLEAVNNFGDKPK